MAFATPCLQHSQEANEFLPFRQHTQKDPQVPHSGAGLSSAHWPITSALTTKDSYSPQQADTAWDYWNEHCAVRMPQELQDAASNSTWQEFLNKLAPARKTLWQLNSYSTPPHGLSTCIFENDKGQFQTVGTGPIACYSNLLASAFASVEITQFHSYNFDTQHCVLLLGATPRNECWAIGFGPSPSHAACSALGQAAHQLHP
ncbi:MAG: hypothetical protein Q3976_09990 [Corynebacterium sp.]|nr:hypothetical protein [Corynebacterium sp.]